jgi:hypothetical protein
LAGQLIGRERERVAVDAGIELLAVAVGGTRSSIGGFVAFTVCRSSEGRFDSAIRSAHQSDSLVMNIA